MTQPRNIFREAFIEAYRQGHPMVPVELDDPVATAVADTTTAILGWYIRTHPEESERIAAAVGREVLGGPLPPVEDPGPFGNGIVHPVPTIIEVDVDAGCYGCGLYSDDDSCGGGLPGHLGPGGGPAPEDCPLRHGDVLVRAKGRAVADDDTLAARAASMTHQDLLDLARRTAEDTTRQVGERITEMEKERKK